MTRHFLTVADLTGAELLALLDDAERLRGDRRRTDDLAGRSVGVIFEKPSTRTRVSFEVGLTELGATPVILDTTQMQLGRGETVADTARVLSRYLHALVVRTGAHARLEDLAEAGTIPVVNALSSTDHPCQALADLQTIRQHRGDLVGVRVAYLGDGNNVATSLLEAGALAGMHVTVASPDGYGLPDGRVRAAEALAAGSGGSVRVTDDPLAAADGAEVVYTDVWTSMGDEATADRRRRELATYAITAAIVEAAVDDVTVMHCLPAHRGEEIAAEVIDGPHSVVWDQAENRLHAQKALLRHLLGGGADG